MTTAHTPKTFYNKHTTERNTRLDSMRDCASMTVPALLPPNGSNDTTTLEKPNQSHGADGLRSLASKFKSVEK